ncbi:MAG: helix-turn-helix domain-containing protein [Acutalibacteraceae bacterium]
MTQLQLAQKMNISDKTVSKWERGLGCPEISLLGDLSEIFNIDLNRIFFDESNFNKIPAGNINKMRFYVCPECNNIIAATSEIGISCCGKNLKPLQPKKADDCERLIVEKTENDFYITSDHPMNKGHYISFAALLTADSVTIKKQYPEWEMQIRIPISGHGRLLWYCTKHGLFYQDV